MEGAAFILICEMGEKKRFSTKTVIKNHHQRGRSDPYVDVSLLLPIGWKSGDTMCPISLPIIVRILSLSI